MSQPAPAVPWIRRPRFAYPLAALLVLAGLLGLVVLDTTFDRVRGALFVAGGLYIAYRAERSPSP